MSLTSILSISGFALISSLLGCGLVLKVFPKLGLMDNPTRYGFKRKPVPYSAGIVFFVVLFFATILFLPFSTKLLGVIAGCAIITLMSFLDDRFNLSPVLRLLIQALVVGIIVVTGTFVFGFNIPFLGWIELGPIWGRLATGIWLLILVNVVNWLDGVPGLATGTSFISFGAIFILSVLPHFHTLPQEGSIVMSLCLSVASLVVFFYSWPKLKLLIGDTGSMVLGLMLGVVAVYSGGKVATAALVLFIPIFDAIWTVLRRLYNRKSPFKGDMQHLHHRLLKAGFSATKLLLSYLLAMTLIAGLTLTILSTQYKTWVGVILLCLMVLLAVIIVYLESKYARSGRTN